MNDPNEPNNPYQAPQTNVVPAAPQVDIGEPVRVPFTRGAGWIGEGFGLFARSWPIWLAITFVLFCLNLVAGFIPFLGPLVAMVLGALFMGGIMLGCDALQRGEPLRFDHLFAGFSSQAMDLFIVGLLFLVGYIVAMVAAMVIGFTVGFTPMFFMSPETMANGSAVGGFLVAMLLVILIFMLLWLPVLMAYWFAPALVVLHKVSAIDAMVLSFKACLRNILPFLLYGIIAAVLFFIGMIPLMLGLLVVAPALMASIYASYRDIFQVDAADRADG